ncbi:uncharacterized protein PV09_01112 [Verruconis gallopava]|uniref:Gfo/Idh/MocA-like oxidoreductase N-terminal domain-containing protein n=1 Tax=Verruconis gallopava TaxID=253628 RepID=A0A0D1XZE0_9PEZI|nr:uncharacterized protein PV09_01112 [Verruconis gallopava]KIW08181.1 hypothetical protein PV09_01112 [Verruconis gallopava]
MSPTRHSSHVTIAIVGTGLIGPRHADAVKAEPGAELFCFVDPNPAVETIAKQHGVQWFASISEMLREKGKPDGAIVCTPNASHVAVSKELLSAGVHVLCEKPLATDVREGADLIEFASRQGLKLLCGHHRRFNRYVSAAKKLLDKQALGKLVAISGLWTLHKPLEYFEAPTEWRKGAKGGPILINLIHEVDILQFLVQSQITRVHAERTISQRGFEAEEGAAILFRFQNGVVGTFVLSDAVPSPHNFESGTGENPMIPKAGMDTYRFMGSEGTLSFPDMRLSTYVGAKQKSWTEQLSFSHIPVPETRVPFELQVENFVAVIQGNAEAVCTGQDGLRAVAVCEAVKKSLESGLPVDL